MDINLSLSKTLKTKPDESGLGFGRIFTDHMFSMDYDIDKGWHNPRIHPYEDIRLDPAATVLHYSQCAFEGLKAYRTPEGINLFRPRDNFKRMNTSCRRLAMPELDEEFVLSALLKLLEIEKDWVPPFPDGTIRNNLKKSEGASLYIRPTIIANDPFLGVHAAHKYLFFIILSPSGAYYPGGMAPIKIYVEDEYVRAVRGGLGFTKAGANYAASILAGEKAQKLGFTQVLWLDGVEKRYIEEVGAMNIFFKINGELVTPELSGSILPGITRDSVLTIARSMGINTIEKKIDVHDLIEAGKRGEIEDAFGTGTAAVISPIGWLTYQDTTVAINNGKTGALAQKLYDMLTDIQYRGEKDEFGWAMKL